MKGLLMTQSDVTDEFLMASTSSSRTSVAFCIQLSKIRFVMAKCSVQSNAAGDGAAAGQRVIQIRKLSRHGDIPLKIGK